MDSFDPQPSGKRSYALLPSLSDQAGSLVIWYLSAMCYHLAIEIHQTLVSLIKILIKYCCIPFDATEKDTHRSLMTFQYSIITANVAYTRHNRR